MLGWGFLAVSLLPLCSVVGVGFLGGFFKASRSAVDILVGVAMPCGVGVVGVAPLATCTPWGNLARLDAPGVALEARSVALALASLGVGSASLVRVLGASFALVLEFA